jgi:hypothetical protein
VYAAAALDDGIGDRVMLGGNLLLAGDRGHSGHDSLLVVVGDRVLRACDRARRSERGEDQMIGVAAPSIGMTAPLT